MLSYDGMPPSENENQLHRKMHSEKIQKRISKITAQLTLTKRHCCGLQNTKKCAHSFLITSPKPDTDQQRTNTTQRHNIYYYARTFLNGSPFQGSRVAVSIPQSTETDNKSHKFPRMLSELSQPSRPTGLYYRDNMTVQFRSLVTPVQLQQTKKAKQFCQLVTTKCETC